MRHFGAKAEETNSKDKFSFRSSRECRLTPVAAQKSLRQFRVCRKGNLPQNAFLFTLLVPTCF